MAASRLIQPADLRRLDIISYNSMFQVIQVWRIVDGKRQVIAERPCKIDSMGQFQNVVREMGRVADLSCTRSDSSLLNTWAYEYV